MEVIENVLTCPSLSMLYGSLLKAVLFEGLNFTQIDHIRDLEKFFSFRRWEIIPSDYTFLTISSWACVYSHPFLCSVWTEESQCTLLNASITETFNCSFSCGPDCWKLSQYPCLQVYVNLTSSGEKLLLYHTEETIKINQKVGTWHTAFQLPRRASHQALCLWSSPLPAFQRKVLPGSRACLFHSENLLCDSCLENIYFLCKLWTNHSYICGSADLAFTSIWKGKY